MGVLASCLLAGACGEAGVGESESTSEGVRPDGEPDCAGDEPWAAEPGIDLDAPGEPTAESALRPFLEQWQGLFGGDIVMVGADDAALTIDGAEVVVAYTTRTNPGGFAVNGSTGCDGYEPDVLPGPPSPDNPNPATAPPLTLPSSTVERSAATTAVVAPSNPATETTTPTTDTEDGGSPVTTVRFPSTSVPSTAAPPATFSGNDAVDGPVIRYPERSDSGEGMDAVVRGVLELDGACLYVALDEIGERYPILWPAGTRWDGQNHAVVSPVGESMAIGDEVYGGGGYLYVDDVDRIAGPQASSLAADCVDNTHGEIAVVNNFDDAIGPAQN